MLPPILLSLFLAAADILAILAAYAAWVLAGRPAEQVWVQGGLALILTVLAALAGVTLLPPAALPDDDRRWLLTYALAFAWLPVLFVPLHFLTQGYLTGWGNLLALWGFAALANALAVLAARWLACRRAWGQAAARR
jgi:hypothetical protein